MGMLTRKLCLAGLAALAAWTPPRAQAAQRVPELVGGLGDLNRLVFQGLATYSAESVTLALRRDLDLLVSAHPCAPLPGYLAMLRDRVRLGYQHGGFAEPQVDAQLDGEKVIVKVTEGPRYVKGSVEVAGAKDAVAGQLVERLTSLDPKGTWLAGEPVQFDPPSVAALTAAVKRAYADLGFLFPDLEVRIAVVKGESAARLRVEVKDEGPTKLGEIEVIGARKNTREDIIEYLGLRPGMALSRSIITEAKQKLWRSARFLSHDVSVKPMEGAADTLRLRIRLKEYPETPPLAQELSARDRALLRLRDRLVAFPTGDQDAVLTMHHPVVSGEMVLSPREGLVARGEAAPPMGGPRLAGGLLAGRGKIGLFTLAGEPQAALMPELGKLMVRLSLRPDTEAKEDTTMLSFGFSLGWASAEPGQGEPPLQLDLDIEPSVFVILASREQVTCTRRDGLLVVTGSNFQMELVEETGELQQLVQFGEKREQEQLRLRFERGRFDALVKELEEAVGERREEVTPLEVLAWLLQRGIAEADVLGGTPAQRRRAAGVCVRLARAFASAMAGLFPVDETVEGTRFTIPMHLDPATPAGATRGIALVLLRWADSLFPHGTWAWTLTREVAWVLCGKGQYTMRALARLYQSDELGPVGCLATAWLVRLVNPPLARGFAAKGLASLSLAGFRRDYQPVLDYDCAFRRAVLRVAAEAATLEAEDIEAIAALLGPEAAAPLRESIRLLRDGRRDGTPALALSSALECWWDPFLEEQLRAALLQLARPPGDDRR